MSGTALAAVLRRRIAATGPLTVAEYMAEALGHPRFGYYVTRDPFGAAGDFVTAPEISQMFGELLGLWCVDAWQRLGAPSPVALVEPGPGRGTLLADALRAARVVPAFLAAVRVHLVESSPVLRRAQAAALAPAGLAVPPAWHGGLAEVPEGPLLAVANEFFDALPVRQFVRTDTGWAERMVDWDDAADRPRWVLAGPVGATALLIPPDRDALPPGGVAEVCPAGLSLAAELGRRVAAHGGAALIVDYGYDTPGRPAGRPRRGGPDGARRFRRPGALGAGAGRGGARPGRPGALPAPARHRGARRPARRGRRSAPGRGGGRRAAPADRAGGHGHAVQGARPGAAGAGRAGGVRGLTGIGP